MQFLRNPVFSGTKRGSKRGIQKGILKGIQNWLFFQGNILIQNRASAKLLAKIRASQVFWDQIKNRVSLRSAFLEAVYLEALLYMENLVIYISLPRLLLVN